MVNQPIPFKEHSTNPKTEAEGKAAGKAPPGTPRPPGEVGGHTVQSWEQDAVPATTAPNSKDVPPPEAGTREAAQPGPGPGMAATRAPGSSPSRTAGTTTTEAPPLSTNPPGSQDATVTTGPQPTQPARPEAKPAAPSETRPARPPVYAPQAGHGPAPRPPASHVPAGQGTDGDALVEAITRAIAENIGKAFHQSVAQAVRDVMPLSFRSVDSGVPAEVQLKEKPAPPAPAKGAASKAAPAAQPAASPPATATPTPAPAKATGAQPSQYGGTIEAPEPAAKAQDEEGEQA